MASSAFMNVHNMSNVMTKLEERLQPRHYVAVDGNARMLVLDVMRDLDRDPRFAEMSLLDKNQLVLRASWELINDLADKADKVADAAGEALPVPDRVLPTLSPVVETPPLQPLQSAMEAFAAYPDAAAPAPLEPVSADDLAADRAAADQVDKIMREPWGPPSRPQDTTVDISVDGFSRDFDLYPSRYRFQYSLGNNVSNVTELSATALLLPVSSGDAGLAIGSPYVLVTFDEFSLVCDDGATSSFRKSFCKFVVDGVGGFPGSRQFARMKVAGGGVRKFLPPMNSLSKLTVSFTLPEGGLISDAQDTHRVERVSLNTDAAANWILQTVRRWSSDFEPGDRVQIRGAATGSARVDDYLNREEGHMVIAGGDFAQFTAQRSSIVIARPTRIGPGGLIVDDDIAQDELKALPAAELAVPARIVNTSLQPSLSLVAVCAPSTRHEAVL